MLGFYPRRRGFESRQIQTLEVLRRRAGFLHRAAEVRIFSSVLRDRLTAGRAALTRRTLVRIWLPEPKAQVRRVISENLKAA
jgi:hypothetical protein